MIIKELSKDYIEIFFNEIYFRKLDLNNKNNIETFLKSITLDLKNKYQLIMSGIYDVKIFVDEVCGFFLILERVDSLYYENEIDFKVSIINNCSFYYKTNDLEIACQCKEVYFYDNNFYTKLPLDVNLVKYIEYGEFVIDKDTLIKEESIQLV